MKILIINPNTSEDFTLRIDEVARAYANSDTVVTTISPEKGPQSIEGMYDAIISAPGILESFLANQADYDAFIMASYGDHPIIYALRQITKKPVIGIAEASMHFACLLGDRFSVVTSSPIWEPLLASAVRKYGLVDRCASVRSIKLPVLALETGYPVDVVQEITKTASIAVEQDGADVICLGSGGMAGLHKQVEAALQVPVVDGITAALKTAESMVQLGLFTSKHSIYAQPKMKPVKGLPESYSAAYE